MLPPSMPGVPVQIQTHGPSELLTLPFNQGDTASHTTPSNPEEIRGASDDPLGHASSRTTSSQVATFVLAASSSQSATASSSNPVAAAKNVKKRAPVACHSCRTSKIRCDGVRPTCDNCTRRRTTCQYDTVPKHRGPDKKPGARVRAPNGTSKKSRVRAHPYKVDGNVNAGPDIPKTDSRPDANALDQPNGDAYRTQWAKRRPQQRFPTIAPPPPPPSEPVSEQSHTSQWSETSPPIALPLHAPSDSPIFYAPPAGPQLPSPRYFPLGPQVITTFDSNHDIQSSHATRIFTPAGIPDGQMQPHDPYAYQNVAATSVSPPDSRTPIVLPSPYPVPLHPSASILVVDNHHQHPEGSREYTESGSQSQSSPDDPSIAREPSLRFSQDTWWDTVLSIYDPNSKPKAAQAIHTDLQVIFRCTSAWLSFVNVPLFFSMFYHPEHRAMMQPALVLGCLAYSAHMQGSEMEGGAKQRRKALKLRDLSQAAFDASYNAGWIDVPLAQAAWIFALFEASAHPETTATRMTSAIFLMDNVIHALGLTYTDADNSRSPVFLAHTVPVMGRREPEVSHTSNLPHPVNISFPASSGRHIQYQMTTQPTPFDSYREVLHRSDASLTSKRCPCAALAMQSAPDQARATPLWLMAPKWTPNATYAEVRRDEGRRLVWSAIAYVGGDVAGRLGMGTPVLDLELVKPENFALLYPGENLYPQYKSIDVIYSGKESTWALYARTLHLWVTCTKYRDVPSSAHDKADFAMKTWMETVAIEDALNEHQCDGEKATMYQAREYIFIIRMYISSEYRRFIPVAQTNVNFSRLDRGRAMQWLQHQNNTALQLRAVAMSDFNSLAAKLLMRRPYLMWWQMTQIRRALVLFEMDTNLTFAVDVALNMLPILLYLQEIWPCAEHRIRSVRLMNDLHSACQRTGRSVPAYSFLSQSHLPKT